MNSNPEANYSLFPSLQAQKDVAGILQHSLDTWGEEQADKYKEKLDEGFKTLLANPNIGRKKDIYFAECRMFHVGRHEIFYRLDEQKIHIVRILRDDMDFEQWF